MHIRMEEIAQHQAREPGIECRDQGLRRIIRILFEHIHVSEGHPEEALHGQHLAGGVGHDRIRRHRRGVAGVLQESIESLEIVRLLDEVTLFQHAGLQFLNHTGDGRARQTRRQPLGNPGSKVEKIEIRQQHITDTGPLNLNHHVLSVFELRRMNLCNRRTGQWFGVNRLIKRLQRSTQLFLDGFANIMKRQCRGAIQTALEFLDILFRENRRRTGNKLPKFDVGGAQRFKGSTQQSRYWRAIAKHPAEPLAPHHPNRLQYPQAATGRVHGQRNAASLASQPGLHVFDVSMIGHNKVLLSWWVRCTT